MTNDPLLQLLEKERDGRQVEFLCQNLQLCILLLKAKPNSIFSSLVMIGMLKLGSVYTKCNILNLYQLPGCTDNFVHPSVHMLINALFTFRLFVLWDLPFLFEINI